MPAGCVFAFPAMIGTSREAGRAKLFATGRVRITGDHGVFMMEVEQELSI
jgi:hypothetical protein